jgi:hypothetical protein
MNQRSITPATSSERITPSAIPLGLNALDRKSLATFLAIFEDSSAISLVTDQIGDLRDKMYSGSVQWVTGGQIATQERFAKRIVATSATIEKCDVPNDALRFSLWAHIRSAFSLEPRIPVSPRDLNCVANDIGAAISATVAQKRRLEQKSDLLKTSAEYWKSVARDANPFSADDDTFVPFDEAVREIVFGLLGAVLGNEDASEQAKKDILDKLRSELSSLDKDILKEANLETLSDEAIQKVLIGGGGLLGLMGAVEAAGFGAYIIAAQASAIIPLVGGKTLVSALFVLSHPLFVLPVIFATGAITAKGLAQTVRKAFAVSVASLLALRGLDRGSLDIDQVCRMFLSTQKLVRQTTAAGSPVTPPQANEYKEITSLISRQIEPPKLDTGTRTVIAQIDRPIDQGASAPFIEGFLFPDRSNTRETVVLGGLSLFDFLYDVSAIDSKVLEAADFSHTADLSDPFVFGEFAERVMSLSAASIRGHEANLLGYTAERIVAERLVENGHLVSMPESASQPGYDLLVDGIEFQVKCIEPENFHILETHFQKYPDTPVIANSEVAEAIADKMPEWGNMVFFIEGYTYEFTDGLVTSSLKAGSEIGDYELIPIIATMSIIKNTHGWWVGQQSLHDASFNVALESIAKGAMAVAGDFVGKGIGGLMFGPAGAYVFGGVLAVAATIESHWISERVDTALDPGRDRDLVQAAKRLLENCIGHLEAKIIGIESKIKSFPDNRISEAMKFKWLWELVFTQVRISEAKALLNKDAYSGERLTISALEFSSQCGVHPHWLQADYQGLLKLLQKPKDRWKKAAGIASSIIRGFRRKGV